MLVAEEVGEPYATHLRLLYDCFEVDFASPRYQLTEMRQLLERAEAHDDILDDIAQAEGALDVAMRMRFGTRNALRELSPPSLELNIAWAQTEAQNVGQRTELLRLNSAFVTIAPQEG
jgi:hypothetical protein